MVSHKRDYCTVVFVSVQTCGRRSHEHRPVSWPLLSFPVPHKLFIVSARGHLSCLRGIKSHSIFGKTIDEAMAVFHACRNGPHMF